MTTLADLREMSWLSRDEAARRIGCHRSTLWLWEHGKRVPSVASVLAMARVYGVDVLTVLEAIRAQQCGEDDHDRKV